jgi:amylosucrase
MGDELGLLNDHSYLQNANKAKDNRWMHRPAMPWELTERRHDSTTVTGRIFAAMQGLILARQDTPQLHGAAPAYPIWTDNQHVFAFLRVDPVSGRLLVLANFSESAQSINLNILAENGIIGTIRDASQPDKPLIKLSGERLELQPFQFMWLTAEEN